MVKDLTFKRSQRNADFFSSFTRIDEKEGI